LLKKAIDAAKDSLHPISLVVVHDDYYRLARSNIMAGSGFRIWCARKAKTIIWTS
jgi:hypothetical protein